MVDREKFAEIGYITRSQHLTDEEELENIVLLLVAVLIWIAAIILVVLGISYFTYRLVRRLRDKRIKT